MFVCCLLSNEVSYRNLLTWQIVHKYFILFIVDEIVSLC